MGVFRTKLRIEAPKKAGNTLFHVRIINGGDHYFGSIAAIYDLFAPITLGVTRGRLYDFVITPGHPYKNKLCTINKAEIRRKKGNRKLPSSIK